MEITHHTIIMVPEIRPLAVLTVMYFYKFRKLLPEAERDAKRTLQWIA